MSGESQRWQGQRSSFPWEQEALDHIKEQMPKAEPYRAWQTFTFTASSGHVREVDLFIATPGGLFLVEIKSHPGTATNNGSTWLFRDGGKLRTIENVTQFPQMIAGLAARHAALAAAAGQDGTEMTVVFDAGQNSEANFALLAGTNLRYVGSVPASDCRDLLAVPASARRLVDTGRFGGLTAYDTRRIVYGTERRAILTHSPELHAHQARGFDGTTLARAARQLDELAATLARGKTRRARDKVEAEIAKITHDAWVRRVITWQLTGDAPRDLRLAWSVDAAARAALEEEIFGKHVLITDHDDWPAAEVIAAYRSQSEAEFSFRQMKDPHAVSFSPMFHWTEHNIHVHVFTCVLALQAAHLMRLQAERAGLRMSVRELLRQLAGIGETVLIYPAERGRPKARRLLTQTTASQDELSQIFQLDRYAPAVRS